MADITVTASAVRGTAQDSALAGATLTAGKVVYRDSRRRLAAVGQQRRRRGEGRRHHAVAADAGQPSTVSRAAT
jgi:hypothetical protein